jgi:hypothetical protein
MRGRDGTWHRFTSGRQLSPHLATTHVKHHGPKQPVVPCAAAVVSECAKHANHPQWGKKEADNGPSARLHEGGGVTVSMLDDDAEQQTTCRLARQPPACREIRRR